MRPKFRGALDLGIHLDGRVPDAEALAQLHLRGIDDRARVASIVHDEVRAELILARRGGPAVQIMPLLPAGDAKQTVLAPLQTHPARRALHGDVEGVAKDPPRAVHDEPADPDA